MKGNFEIQVNEKYIISQLVDGVQMNPDYSADLDAYSTNIIKRGWETWNGDGCIHAAVKELSIYEFLKVMSLDGGDVKGFGPYVKILSSDLTNEVPVGLPNRTKQVNTGTKEEPVYEERIKPWDEWIGTNYTKTEVEGYTYFLSYAGNNGNFLSGSELLTINNLAYAELVDELPIIEEII